MGNVAVTVNGQYQVGNRRLIDATVAFAASYATNGDSYTAAMFQLSNLDPATIMVCGGGTQNGTRTVLQDVTNKKFKLYTTAGNEAANASDNHLVTIRVWAFGFP